MLKIDRKIDYDVSVKNSRTETIDNKIFVSPPETVLISIGAAVDSKDQIWILSYKKQPERKIDEDLLVLEIFNPDGVLLGSLPLKGQINTPGNAIKIFNGRLYIVETYGKIIITEYIVKET